jgi:hypothetical protein
MKDRVRDRADMKNSKFVEDPELVQYINASYQELYDILVQSFEDYYTLPPLPLSIPSGQDYFDLPLDFYKLRGVDAALDNGSDFYTMSPFNFARRNRKGQSLVRLDLIQYDKNYRIVGNRLYITPPERAPGNYRIWYVPKATTLQLDTDTLDGINGWEEYVVVDAARKCLLKEESDTAVNFLTMEKEALKKRIKDASQRRDAGMPKTITDITLVNSDEWWKY